MAIKEIAVNGLPLEPLKTNKAGVTKDSRPGSKDKVELSAQARSLFEAEKMKKIESVKKKIDEGFYLTDEVNVKVVDGLMNDLKKPT
jgi:anti-sigma28 factor (negative regulator of flagellin synthesis)